MGSDPGKLFSINYLVNNSLALPISFFPSVLIQMYFDLSSYLSISCRGLTLIVHGSPQRFDWRAQRANQLGAAVGLYKNGFFICLVDHQYILLTICPLKSRGATILFHFVKSISQNKRISI